MTNAVTRLDCSLATLAIDADNELTLATLTPDSVAYLLEYGLNKSLQDASAGAIKAYGEAFAASPRSKAQTKLFDSGCELLDVEGDNAESAYTAESFGKAVANAKRAARLAAIMAGTMRPSGLGSRLSGIDRIARDIAVDMIRAACKARNVKLPDTEKLHEMAAALIAKDDKIMAEAQRRIDLTATAIDLSDLT